MLQGGIIAGMYSVLYGNDVIAVRSALLKKTGAAAEVGVVVTQIDSDTYSPGIFSDAVGGTSLFGEAMLFVVDTTMAKADFKAELTESLSALKESPHEFIVIEGSLLAEDKKKHIEWFRDQLEKERKEAMQKVAKSIEDYEEAERKQINDLVKKEVIGKAKTIFPDFVSEEDQLDLIIKSLDNAKNELR